MKATTSAISLGLPSRPSGVICAALARNESHNIAVSVNPGDTVLTVTPLDASSCANPLVQLLERRLGSEVGRRSGKTEVRAPGREVHDPAPVSDDFRRLLHREVGAFGVHGKDLIELLLGRIN